jgi:hypothetical protein
LSLLKGTFISKYRLFLNSGEDKSVAELKHSHLIVTDTKELPPETRERLARMRKEGNSTIEATRLLWLDDEVVPGSSLYMECLWLWGGSSEGTMEEPHVHDFDEIIGFAGSNRDNPKDLGGEIEIWLDDEKHTLTQSCLVYLPAGFKHCPLILKRIDSPVFFFTIGNKSTYDRESKEG